MRPSLSIKTLYRSLVKTLLTFILLGVVTFAFFSQTAEYAITTREFNNAAGQYCGVGSAEIDPTADSYPGDPTYINTDPRMLQSYSEEAKEYYLKMLRYKPLTQEQVSEISALPYITSTETRYMTAGVSDTFYRLDEEAFYNYTARCVIEGTLTEFRLGQLILNDCKLLAGNLAWAFDQEKILINADTKTYKEYESDSLRVGGIVGSRALYVHDHNYKYGAEYQQNLTPGSRYVFVLRFDPLMEQSYYLSDHLTEPWCGAVWSVDGAPADYLETDEYAPLQELIEITNADAHTFDMVYSDDMSSILRFAEDNMAIIDGRALNKEGSVNGSNVCVVSREIAEANQFEVGDKIIMQLGTELFEQYKGIGAVAATRERYRPAEKTIELEIVGIYADLDGHQQNSKPHWSYSINTIFVSKSLLPIDESQLTDHMFSPAEYSFKVENAWDIPAFLEESAPIFKEMGLQLIFDDDGWPDIADAFRAAREFSIIKVAVLSAAITAATGFVVYLFIGRKKKEYAVMRALGTTKKVSARALSLPLMAVTAASVLAGSGAAWIYTVKTIAHNNTLSMMKEYAVSISVPVGVSVGCILGEVLLTLLFAILLLRHIGALPPLSLLQDNRNRRACGSKKTNREKSAGIVANPLMTAAPTGPLVSTPPVAGATIKKTTEPGVPEPVREIHKSGSLRFVLRYIRKHMHRSARKSALAVLLAALLFIAVGQLALMKQSYARLRDETVITARFVGGLPLTSVPQIVQSVYVKNPYYEVRENVDLNSSQANLVFTNDIARYTNGETDITYADGYDASCMDKFGEILIAGKVLMAKYGLEPGDTVKMTPRGYLANLQLARIDEYRTVHPMDDITDNEILALYQDEIMTALNSVTRTYIVAGVVTTPAGVYDDMAFTPGNYKAFLVVGVSVKLDVAEFTLSDNPRVDEFRSFGEKMAGGATGSVTFVMDTSKLENLRNTLRLLDTMYPVALTASLLIGGFLCCLVIVQSLKEAAIMRILGTTKRKTRTMLALEQIILSIAGLVIGAGALLLYKGLALAGILNQLLLFVALYFAVILVSAVICSAAATRRNVLELLQTKE